MYGILQIISVITVELFQVLCSKREQWNSPVICKRWTRTKFKSQHKTTFCGWKPKPTFWPKIKIFKPFGKISWKSWTLTTKNIPFQAQRSLQSFSVRHGIPQQHPLDADLRLKYSIPNTFATLGWTTPLRWRSSLLNRYTVRCCTRILIIIILLLLLQKKKLSKRSRDQLDVSNVEAAQLAAALLMSNETAEREHRLRHASVRPRKNRPRPRTEDHDDCLSVTKRPRNKGCADSFTF